MDKKLQTSALHDLHQEQKAAFGEVDGWEMPLVYGNFKLEYLAAKGTVAVMDRSNHGRLRVSGTKRFDLLNRLTTNDLRTIEAGQGARTALLTDKGRIIDDLRLHVREEFFYLITSPGNEGCVKETIEKLRFRDDVTLDDVTRATAMISLFGPQSGHLLEGVTRARKLDEVPSHHCIQLTAGGTSFLAARTAEVGGSGFNLIMPAEAAGEVWNALLNGGPSYGVSPCGEEAYEMLRIEYGVPRFGRELTEDYNALEAGLGDAINWKKGCYVGQEVIARLDSRQKISKLLVGLWMDPGPLPAVGSSIEIPGKTSIVGTLTSVAPSIDFRRLVALGFVRNAHSTPGTRLEVVSSDDRIEAEVSALPFRQLQGDRETTAT